MEAHKLKFVLLLIVGVAINFLLVLGKQERALMFLQDRQFEQAKFLYEELQLENSADRYNLAPLSEIYLSKGEPATAIQIYEYYLKEHPEDIEVWERLVNLYEDTLRHYDLINALEQLVQIHPNLKYYEQLVRFYEASGVKDGRLLAALEQVVKLDPGRESDILNLILLQAGSGHIVEASRVMDDYVASFPEKMNDNLTELRLRLLLSSGHVHEAFAWTEQWLKNHQSLSMRYVALLYSGGQSGNLDIALDTPVIVDPEKMPTWLISAVMIAGWDSGKIDILEGFVSRLGEDVVSEYPVIMAALALNRNNKAEINKWLEMAENRSDLTLRQQLHLMMIYFRSDRASNGLLLLSKMAQKPEIPAPLLAQAAPFLMKSNHIDDGLAIFQSLREQREEDNIINETWALFAAAAGKTQAVTEWLDEAVDGNIPRGKLKDLYYVAIDRSHFDLAATVGRQLYSRYKGPDEARLLLRALLGMDRSAEVHIELAALLKQRKHYLNVSRKVQRELAFQLLRVGEKQAAIEEFKRLAKSEGPQGKNVQQLLFVWGAMPGETALNWLEARARKAPPYELAGWWRYLAQAGGAERVAAFSAYIDADLPAEAEDVFLNALTVEGDSSELDKQLQKLAERTESSGRLMELAVLASNARRSETEEAIWQKLHNVEPTNTKAMRALGIAAYNRGDMQKAENYLTQLASLSEGDWETAFYLGEVYSAYERKSDAELYYRKSLQFIDTDAGDKKRKDLARAYVMYRLGEIQVAMNIYQELIESYPDDLDVRTTYSAILIDEGHLETASSLLGDKR